MAFESAFSKQKRTIKTAFVILAIQSNGQCSRHEFTIISTLVELISAINAKTIFNVIYQSLTVVPVNERVS